MMKTQHGVKMSPRMERLWRYIREERSIGLTDFSTDECVKRELPKLNAAMKEIEKRREKSPKDTNLRHMQLDLAAIMRRLPAARTDNRNLATKEADVERGTDLADPLAHMIEFE